MSLSSDAGSFENLWDITFLGRIVRKISHVNIMIENHGPGFN